MTRLIRNASFVVFLIAATTSSVAPVQAQSCWQYILLQCGTDNVHETTGGYDYGTPNLCSGGDCGAFEYCCADICIEEYEVEEPTLNDCNEGGGIDGICRCI